MSTIADVAARAGVSKATASRALSGRGYVAEETRQRVRVAAGDLDFVAHPSATSLATGRTHTVGLIMPPVNRWFFSELLAGIEESLCELDYELALRSVRDGTSAREHLHKTLLLRRRFDGIIAAGIPPEQYDLDKQYGSNRPLVSVGPSIEGSSAVAIDDFATCRIATEHLLDLGHTKIAFLGGAPEAGALGFSDARRIDGYLDALRTANLAEFAHIVECASTMPAGYAAAIEVLSDRRRRPTAIVGICDEVALGAIVAARRLGISVPTELSTIGIDDHQHAEMFALTTMKQSPRAQGRDAVRLLHERMQHSDMPAERIVAPASLVVRNSTAPPR